MCVPPSPKHPSSQISVIRLGFIYNILHFSLVLVIFLYLINLIQGSTGWASKDCDTSLERKQYPTQSLRRLYQLAIDFHIVSTGFHIGHIFFISFSLGCSFPFLEVRVFNFCLVVSQFWKRWKKYIFFQSATLNPKKYGYILSSLLLMQGHMVLESRKQELWPLNAQ